jgi:hypothetical protein
MNSLLAGVRSALTGITRAPSACRLQTLSERPTHHFNTLLQTRLFHVTQDVIRNVAIIGAASSPDLPCHRQRAPDATCVPAQPTSTTAKPP